MKHDEIVFPVGNKDDDPEMKVVLTQDAQRFAEQMDIELYETSAKEDKNVEQVGIWMIRFSQDFVTGIHC